MAPTINDICQLTGYSTATVSRVLNHSPLVTNVTRERVQAALDRLGYQPNHAARALKLNRTGMLAVVFPELDNGFFTDVLRGVDEMASKSSVHLLTAFSHGPLDEQELITRIIRERRADALILMNLTLQETFLQKIERWKLPIVLIDRPLAKSRLASVGIDNRSGVAAMVRHLVVLGHRNIVFLAGPAGTYDADERLAAFRQAMQNSGRPCPAAAIWHGDFTEASGEQRMREWLATARKLPDAIFAANDAMATGLLHVLRETGHRVPDDIAVVGFDDADSSRHLDLTTIHVPMRELGREAARLAMLLAEGQKPPAAHVMLPTRLVIRHSCLATSGSNNHPST